MPPSAERALQVRCTVGKAKQRCLLRAVLLADVGDDLRAERQPVRVVGAASFDVRLQAGEIVSLDLGRAVGAEMGQRDADVSADPRCPKTRRFVHDVVVVRWPAAIVRMRLTPGGTGIVAC